MPSNSIGFKIVIRADRKPQIEHHCSFNTPQTDNVVVLNIHKNLPKEELRTHIQIY